MNTTFFLNQIMSASFVGKTFYVGLSSTEPNVCGTGYTEPEAATYARATLSSFSTPVGGVVSNASAVTFGKTVQDWFADGEKASYWLLFDGSGSTAHLLSYGELITKKEIRFNVNVSIPANALKIRLFNSFDDLEDGE